MRLKTFFFPLMLVISVSIFAGYVWPEITRLRDANEVKMSKVKELSEVNVKKGAIESIGNEISNSDGEKMLKDYLPEKKTEERIISSINYLADSANVSLSDITLAGDTAPAANNSEAPAGLAGILNPMVTAESVATTQAATTQAANNQAAANTFSPNMQMVTMNVSINGSYEKIRVFLNGLSTLPIFNNIKSLSIKKQQDEKKIAADTSSANLSADVVVDFGYMQVVKVDGKKVASFNSNIDNTTIAVLKKYISQEKQIGDSTVDSKGRNNPFFAN